jgi:phosphate starvation-inducible PhoH-like protein
MIEATIPVGDAEELVLLLGTSDQHLRRIRDSVPAKISTRNGKIHVSGDEQAVLQATEIIEQIKTTIVRDGLVAPEQVSQIIKQVTGGTTNGRSTAVDEKLIGKIVLVRPAVEAGENLGFLPGDMQAKINPYLRPLLDALREMMDYEQVKRYMADDVIEVVPLAYMRGRTLNNAFIIMDEAQNTTVPQMKMFLTRMGLQSKVVVSGDTSQVDLPPHTKSGLIDAIGRLRYIDGYANIVLTKDDIVRHRLVQDIVRAYEEGSKRKR